MRNLCITIFIVIFVILLVYIWIQQTAPKLQVDAKKLINLNLFLQEANNGDLIFLSGDTPGERTCRWFMGSPFSHVGILFREDNILYIWDADLGQKTRDGPRVSKLTDKLDLYHGFKTLGWRRLEGKRPSLNAILTIVHKYKEYNFDNSMISWFFSDIWTIKECKTVFSFGKEDCPAKCETVFCSELVAMTLQDLEIMDNTKVPYWYSPQTFDREIFIGLGKNYRYSKMYFASFSP